MTQIFRITHINNLPFILQNGIYCPTSSVLDPNFEPIGFPTLIEHRKDTPVPIKPGGTLADYIPFYFWFKSPMLYVIFRGNDPEVIQTKQEDIVYLVCSFESLKENNAQFVFTDRHAKLDYANFYNEPADIVNLNWDNIKTERWSREFGAEIREMKQAECLVYNFVPKEAIIGIAVFDDTAAAVVSKHLSDSKIEIPLKVKPNFYY